MYATNDSRRGRYDRRESSPRGPHTAPNRLIQSEKYHLGHLLTGLGFDRSLVALLRTGRSPSKVWSKNVNRKRVAILLFTRCFAGMKQTLRHREHGVWIARFIRVKTDTKFVPRSPITTTEINLRISARGFHTMPQTMMPAPETPKDEPIAVRTLE